MDKESPDKGIREWQKEFVKAVNRRFPKQFTKEQRVLSAFRQLSDVSSKMQFGGDVEHRIAAVLVDLFLLAEDYQMDLDGELKNVLAWFNNNQSQFTDLEKNTPQA